MKGRTQLTSYPAIIPAKECFSCKEIKPTDHFYNDKNKKDGKSSWCKRCKNNYRYNYGKTVVAKNRAIKRFAENKLKQVEAFGRVKGALSTLSVFDKIIFISDDVYEIRYGQFNSHTNSLNEYRVLRSYKGALNFCKKRGMAFKITYL